MTGSDRTILDESWTSSLNGTIKKYSHNSFVVCNRYSKRMNSKNFNEFSDSKTFFTETWCCVIQLSKAI